MTDISEVLKQRNDNVSNSNLKNNVNVSENQVNLIAEKLSNQLSNPGGWQFYCKVGWKLPEATIWNHLETALQGNNPKKYFSWLCKRELDKITV